MIKASKNKKYRQWFGLDGGDSFFNWWFSNAEEYRDFIKRLKLQMAQNASNGCWRAGDKWMLAQARRGLRIVKKGKIYKQRNPPGKG